MPFSFVRCNGEEEFDASNYTTNVIESLLKKYDRSIRPDVGEGNGFCFLKI